jgi:hypothetical protein
MPGQCEGLLEAHGAGGLAAQVTLNEEACPDVLENRFDSEPCAALLECAALRAELPALRVEDYNDMLDAMEVRAASDAAAAAAAAARWASMSEVARQKLMKESSEVPPDFFKVLDPSTPPLVILPGDMRFKVRWNERGGHGDPGYGTALLLRRVAPAAPPAVAPPAGPPPDYEAYREYRFSDDF